MRPLFEPAPVNDAFGDPGLYVDFRDERRALLFDLGDVAALPPRKLLRISDIFVTHAHLDHFVGFDHWLRVVLGRKERVRLYGGPGFVTTPVEVYFRTGDRIAFEVHIPKNMELYKAQHDNKGPKTHEEFMQVIIKEGGVDLPELPADEAYLYDPQTEQLMIRRMQPPATEAPPSK